MKTMKTMKTMKIKLFIIVLICFIFSIKSKAQTSTSPTQDVCVGSTEPYLLNPSNSTSSYQWTLNGGGVISSGQGSGSILIDWNTNAGGPYTLTVVETDINGCVGLPKTVDVTLHDLDNATFILTDFCEGSSNSASSIISPGGTFYFNPIPTNGETLDPITAEITGGIAGNTYFVEYITNGLCPQQNIESVLVNSLDDASFSLNNYCADSPNSASAIVTVGGVFSFNPVPTGGEIINATTGEITGGIPGNTYTVEYTTIGTCSSSQTQNVLIYSLPSTGPIFHN
tara:strand:+ start:203 stop:1054 length:852 start_codon:yes stop_codon:yes gene_type:complete